MSDKKHTVYFQVPPPLAEARSTVCAPTVPPDDWRS